MAEQQTMGGLGAMAPRPQVAPPPEPSVAKEASRVSSMEQDTSDTPQSMMDRAIQKQRLAAQSLEAQTALLRQSYDARMSLPFDTSLMAAAAGFLKPTKTGSFGESLGYAAENYSADAEKALLRKQQAEKAKLDLAIQEQAMNTKNMEFEHLLKMSGYNPDQATTLTVDAGAQNPTPVPTAASATQALGESDRKATSAVAGVPTASRAGGVGAVGQTGAPNQMRLITDADLTTAQAISPEYGKRLAEIAKMQREDIISTPEGPFSRSLQKYLDVNAPNAVPKEYDFGPAGPRKTTPDVYRQYRDIVSAGTDEDLRNFFIKQRWLAGKPSTPAGGTAPAGTSAVTKPAAGVAGVPNTLGIPDRFKSPDEQQQEKIALEAQGEEAKTYAKSAGEMASNLRESAFNAPDIKGLAQEAGSIAKAAPNAFKLLMNKDSGLRNEMDVFLQAVKTGVQTPFGSFNIPAELIDKNKLTDVEIQALQKYAQIESQFTLFNRRLYLKGQGAISNGENGVAAQLGPQAGDRPEVIQMKAQAIERKADFDEETFNAFEKWRDANPSGGFSKFIAQSPEFKALKTEYIADLKAMRESNARYFSGEKKPASSAAPAPVQTNPPVTKPATQLPANESPLERFKREKAEREKAAQGKL
jgi:hypothetical protein